MTPLIIQKVSWKNTQKLFWLYCQRCRVRTDHVLTVYDNVEVYTCTTPGCSQVKEYTTRSDEN